MSKKKETEDNLNKNFDHKRKRVDPRRQKDLFSSQNTKNKTETEYTLAPVETFTETYARDEQSEKKEQNSSKKKNDRDRHNTSVNTMTQRRSGDFRRKTNLEAENDQWIEKMHEKPHALRSEITQQEENEAFDRFTPNFSKEQNSLLSLQEQWASSSKEESTALSHDGKDRLKELQAFFLSEAKEDIPSDPFSPSYRYLTNSSEKSWKMQRRIISSNGRFLLSYAEQDKVGDGMKEVSENVLPVVAAVFQMGKRTMGTFSVASLSSDKKFQDAIALLASGEFKKYNLSIPENQNWNMTDVKKVHTEIRNILSREGIGRFSSDGSYMMSQVFRGKLKQRFGDQNAKALYIVSMKLSLAQSFSKGRKMQFIRPMNRQGRKWMRQDATSNAILTTGYIFHYTSRASLFAAKQAAILSAKGVTAAAKSKLAQTVADKGHAVNNIIQNATQANRKTRNFFENRTKRKRLRSKKKLERRAKTNKILDAVLPHRFITNRILKPAAAFITKGRYNPIRWLGNVFGWANGVVKGFASLLGGFLLLLLAFFMLGAIVLIIIEQFDWASNEKETRDKCFDIITTCWDAQMDQMQNYGLGEGYRNVIYTFNDRDKDPDNDHKTNPSYTEEELNYTETTNSVEILSMAQVYFDFDLDSASPEELTSYIRGLYNGSHIITTKEIESQEKDEYGNAKYTDLEVILTTYYFDELFECSITSSFNGGESAIAGESFVVPQDFRQSITYEGTMEWAKGVAKSPSNPMKQVVDAWYQNGQNIGTQEDGMLSTPCIIVGGQKRYLCAIVQHFGQIGDYVDAYLEDGTILPLILIDNKGCYDGGSYHNLTTNFMFNQFHYGHTLSPGDQSVCSVLEFMKSSGSPSGNPSSYCKRLAPVSGSGSNSIKVTKLVNGGSFLKNPSGPKYINGDSAQVDVNNANARAFLGKIEEMSTLIKQNATHVKRSGSCERSYSVFKRKLMHGENAYINCIAPAKWALEELGLLPEGVAFYGHTDGTFHMPSGQTKRKLLNKMTLFNSGGPVQMTLTEAAQAGKLQPGDIVNLSSSTYSHSVVYVGTNEQGHPMVYDGGGEAEKEGYAKVGCYVDYNKAYKNSKIRTILRWK